MMKQIQHFIGETDPYLFDLKHLTIKESTMEYTVPSDSCLVFSDFYKITQIASSLGSLALAKTMDVTEKTYFLGEKLRIRKIDNRSLDKGLKYCARSIEYSSRKGKSLVDILDEHNQLAYTFELDYFIFSEDSFYRLFKNYAITHHEPSTRTSLTVEKVEIEEIESSFFRIVIQPFSKEDCAGHFNQYPIVAAVFVVKQLLCAIEQFFEVKGIGLEQKKLNVDSLEMFLNVAVPIDTVLHSKIYYHQIAKESYVFVCPVCDDTTEYGNYLITVNYSFL
ncbi:MULTISPECIES: hypothetical protein [unclassified Myroides]|uniref:hypothetical protein n=1 Tax=unclassified Myroides TaxID=2642485 RepID=UPI002576BD3B|nr:MULTISPECIES: hypothetical protein [unclassified Myroides]